MINRFSNQQFLEIVNDENKLDIGSFKILLEQFYGERNELDFKESMIEVHKLAKLILAMANSGGGTIVFGITDDTNEAVGLNETDVEDPTDLERKLRNIIPDQLQFDSQIIRYPQHEVYLNLSGKLFFIIYVLNEERYIPFLSKRPTTGIETNRIYIRRNASIEEANNYEIEQMIIKRVHSVYSDLSSLDLQEHLQQLKILYTNISEYEMKSPFENINKLGIYNKVINRSYPTESFNLYISRCIEKKKRKIEEILEILE
ncbi:AlbA family DNA-binding domain-containing protein [Neobacillus cucumis]|uniref:Schlafen AlbA-2 domain-containing protein n=1 Tax=Neobacillus cucumis TaxID=1740721 RepID=A0A2N5HEX2_9BACI|nr:ATP-binding protein [Neobacillus cucumis]PLS04013.1 hypothetical protein CVD27_12700 [Neobacillus cucumis]